jgi:uncharacterized repeat protein (TIGR01451 family)
MNGPEAVEVGKTAQVRIEVTNTSSLPLENVSVSDVFDPGLKHADGGESPIVRPLGRLEPGETKRFAVTFLLTQPGRQRHRLSVTADGGQSAATSGVVTGVQRTLGPARLELNVKGPKQLAAGQEGEYLVEITNVGDLPAQRVRIVADYGPHLKPTVATGGKQRETGPTFLAWQVDRLEAGETITRQVNGIAEGSGAVSVRFEVTAERNLHELAEVVTTVGRASSARPPLLNEPSLNDPNAPPQPSAGANAAAAGELKLTIAQANGRIAKGGKTALIILVHNDRPAADENVALTFLLPAGLRFEKMTGPTDVRHVSPDGRTIETQPVATMRAGERLTEYRLEVTGLLPGEQTLEVTARSAGTSSPAAARATVSVAAE